MATALRSARFRTLLQVSIMTLENTLFLMGVLVLAFALVLHGMTRRWTRRDHLSSNIVIDTNALSVRLGHVRKTYAATVCARPQETLRHEQLLASTRKLVRGLRFFQKRMEPLIDFDSR